MPRTGVKVTITTPDGEVLDTFYITQDEQQTQLRLAEAVRDTLELHFEVGD